MNLKKPNRKLSQPASLSFVLGALLLQLSNHLQAFLLQKVRALLLLTVLIRINSGVAGVVLGAVVEDAGGDWYQGHSSVTPFLSDSSLQRPSPSLSVPLVDIVRYFTAAIAS